jgi:hypothetical protein
MGNTESDLGEQEAWAVIGHIPLINTLYGGVRAAVYASKGNMAEARSGAIGMVPFAHSVIHGVIPAVVQRAIEVTEEALRGREEELRRKYWVFMGVWDIFVGSQRVAEAWIGRERQGLVEEILGGVMRRLKRE